MSPVAIRLSKGCWKRVNSTPRLNVPSRVLADRVTRTTGFGTSKGGVADGASQQAKTKGEPSCLHHGPPRPACQRGRSLQEAV